MVLLGCTAQSEQTSSQPELRFKEDGTFKILQLSDPHWDGAPERNARLEEIITKVVDKENPDFIMLTGDVVLNPNEVMSQWKDVINILESTSIPYSVVPGNHDPECADMDEVYDLLLQQPHFIGEKGPEELTGIGNFALEVKASDGSDKTQAVMYCFDSGNISSSREDYGYYYWLEADQIDWYKARSREYKAANGNKPVPSVAFFHIPLPEYNYIRPIDRHGFFGERVCCPEINSGMYFSMSQMGDIMGTFVGHDHNNDFIGKFFNIALAYGRTTGWGLSRECEAGGRVIILKEGKHQFETYNTTPDKTEFTYYYPSGITTKDKEQYAYHPALDVKPTENGLKYTYCEGNFLSTDDIRKIGKNHQSGVMPNFDITKAAAKDHFAYIFEGYVNITESDVYIFYINSDDGAKLYIDGELLLDNDGSHGTDRKGAKIGLEKGFHEIRVDYFDDYAEEELRVRMTSTNIPLGKIDDKNLFIK